MLDLPGEDAEQWAALVHASGDRVAFRERYGEATQSNVVRFLTFDLDNPNSIARCVQGARENARSVRDTISSEMWEQINTMYWFLDSSRNSLGGEPLFEFFHRVRMACHLFQGVRMSP